MSRDSKKNDTCVWQTGLSRRKLLQHMGLGVAGIHLLPAPAHANPLPGAGGFNRIVQIFTESAEILPPWPPSAFSWAGLPTAYIQGIHLGVRSPALTAPYILSGKLSLSAARPYPSFLESLAPHYIEVESIKKSQNMLQVISKSIHDNPRSHVALRLQETKHLSKYLPKNIAKNLKAITHMLATTPDPFAPHKALKKPLSESTTLVILGHPPMSAPSSTWAILIGNGIPKNTLIGSTTPSGNALGWNQELGIPEPRNLENTIRPDYVIDFLRQLVT